jgi:hypothetical protein
LVYNIGKTWYEDIFLKGCCFVLYIRGVVEGSVIDVRNGKKMTYLKVYDGKGLVTVFVQDGKYSVGDVVSIPVMIKTDKAFISEHIEDNKKE